MTNHDVSGSTTPNRITELEAQLAEAQDYLSLKEKEFDTAERNWRDAKRNVEDLEVRIEMTKLLLSGESLAGYFRRA